MAVEAVESPGAQCALGVFLKTFRQRIPHETAALGNVKRQPSRPGRPVTQEELAEVVGVTRGWYRMLESGAAVRPSVHLLDRLAGALGLSTDERTTLFALAVPEINRAHLHADTGAILEAFSWVRALAKRLWVASSEVEAFRDVTEALASRFTDALLVESMRRSDTGVWDRRFSVNRASADAQLIGSQICRQHRESYGTTGVDKLMLYPQLSEAGSVGTSDLLSPTSQRLRNYAYTSHMLEAPDFVHARVRSRGGLIAGFSIMHSKGRNYSATDAAVLGGLADMTSLALS